jgi:hypothetical protein
MARRHRRALSGLPTDKPGYSSEGGCRGVRSLLHAQPQALSDGEPVPIYAKEIPVFWGCGVTPQAVAEKARVDLMITHEPGQMFLTDLPREGGRRS